MAVCACGNTMVLGEPWCKACWARWSTWFMRAAGVWVDLETGLHYNGVGRCDCKLCQDQALSMLIVDAEELAVVTATYGFR